MPAGTAFTTSVDGTSYQFVTVSDVTSSNIGNNISFDSTLVYEGTYVTTKYLVDTSDVDQRFILTDPTTDTSTLSVKVQASATDTTTTTYTKATDISQLTGASTVYYLQEIEAGRLEVYFGDGVVGKSPETGDQVELQYNLSMLGSDGNGAKTFTFADSVTGVTGITPTLSSGYTRSIAGSERETAANIRANAPREFQMQKRVVTGDDYRARLLNDYGSIEAVRVWDGSELDPPEYGRVYIAAKPTSGLRMSAAEKYRIKNDLIKTRSVLGIQPVIVDPEYLTILLDCSVTYDPRQTTRTEDEVMTVVKNAIANYSSTTLNKFDEIYRNSVLTREIDNSEISIKNSATEITVMRSFPARLRTSANYIIDFSNPLHHPHDGHQSILKSDLFNIAGFTNVELFDLDGRIYIRRGLGSQDRGTSQFPRAAVGSVDYNTGVVNIQLSITSTLTSSTDLRLYVRPDRKRSEERRVGKECRSRWST